MLRPTPRKFAYEKLEDRNLLAGLVTLTRDTDRNLLISGNSADNRITVQQTSPTSFKVTGATYGGSATSVRIGTASSASSRTISEVFGNVVIVMNAGNDRVDVLGASSSSRFTVAKDLFIYGDARSTSETSDISGEDYIRLQNVRVNDQLVVRSQRGDDSVTLTSVSVANGTFVYTGYDNDVLRMTAVNCADNMFIDTGANGASSAADEVLLDDVYVGNPIYSNDFILRIRTSAGNDKVQLRDTRTDAFECYLLAGNDLLNLIRCHWDDTWNAQGGDGTDTLNRYPGPGASFGYTSFKNRSNINSFPV